MNLARLAHRHARALLLITALLAVAGLLSAPSLPSSIYPPLAFPRLIVIAHSGILPTRTMMLTVTRPLEQTAMEIPGVRRVRSITFRGASEISAQFAPSTDMVVALQQLQGRVTEVRTDLPANTDVQVERLTPEAFPVLSLNLTGELSSAELRDHAYYVLRPALARAPGVGRVEVMSSDSREIEVVVDPARLRASGLTVADVSAALAASNVLDPVARFTSGGRQHLVLASGQWRSADDISRTPVAVRKGATIRVADIAEVFAGAPDRTGLITGNGRDAAVINISQQIGSSILEVKAGIDRALAEISRALPSGLRITKVYDLGDFVSSAMANVRDAILIGGLLAVLVLFAFLRNWRMTLVASVTLPITAAATFFFMRLFGQTINLMSMGGLAVAMGLVIDNAVVIVESIHRRLALGSDTGAIEQATAELTVPLVSSTLTTVVVFAPLGLLSGVAGDFFRSLSVTLSVAVLLSLFLALTLIPVLARTGLGRTASSPHLDGRLHRIYARTLDATLARPWWAVVAMAALVVLAVLSHSWVGSGFLPEMDEGGFVIDYLTPAGTALEETDRQVRRIEEMLATVPEVAAFSRRTGAEMGLFATQQNDGDVLVRLKPLAERDRSAEEIMADLRARLQKALPGLEIEFVQILQDMLGDLEGAPTPIEVKIFGDDAAVLAQLAGQIEPLVAGVPGVVDLVGPQRGNPEVEWRIDPVAAGRLGLTVEQVAEQLADAWLGDVATELHLLDRGVPVRIRYPDGVRFDPERLASLPVRAADGQLVPVGTLVTAHYSDSQAVLDREDLREMALLTARLEGRDLRSAVDEIRARLDRVPLPVGYSYEVGGQYESQRQAFGQLLEVFAIAVALVLVILVIEFHSFTPALLILAAAPLSFGGAFLALLASGTELNVSSAMGLILLVGLVVKNGIVLLDYAHRLHDAGQSWHEAIAAAAQVRLRPILMTTLCTLFGLLPLALGLGAGAELQKPLAVAVIGGLSLSTLVTIYAVPSLYLATHRH